MDTAMSKSLGMDTDTSKSPGVDTETAKSLGAVMFVFFVNFVQHGYVCFFGEFCSARLCLFFL